MLFAALLCYRITRIWLDSWYSLIRVTNGRQQITDRNQSPKLVRQNNFSFPHPDFISENAIIYPLIHFQMPSTFSCGPDDGTRKFAAIWPLRAGMSRSSQRNNCLSCGFDGKTIKRPFWDDHLFMATHFVKKKNNTQLEVNVNIPFEYLSNFERSLHFNKEVHVLIYVFKRDWEDAIYDFTHFISLYNEAKPLVNTNNDIRWNWSSHPALLCYWITHLRLVLTKSLFDNVIESVRERWAWC